MKKLITTIFAAVLVASSPAWGGDDRHDRGETNDGDGRHYDKHAEKPWKEERKYWAKNHHDDDHRVVDRYYAQPPRVAEQHYYHYAAPRVYSPPPGIHIALPGVYVPF